MNDGKDNLRSVYSNLKNDGYDMPDFDTFVKDMASEDNLRGVHNTLTNEGYDVPDFDVFRGDMGFGGATPTSAQPAAPTQQPAASAQQRKVKGQSTGKATTYRQGGGGEVYTPGASGQKAPKAKAGEKTQQKAAQHRAKSAQRGKEYAEAVEAQQQAGIAPGIMPLGMTNFDNGTNSVREGADETNAEIAELDKQIAAMEAEMMSVEMTPEGLYSGQKYARRDELQMLKVARHKAAQRKRVYDREQGQYNFVQTVWQVLTSPDTWDFGASQLRDASVMAKYGDKELSGEQAKAKDAMMRNAMQTRQVQQTIGKNDTGWQRWGDIAAQAIPFVAEFALTGGGYGALSAGGRYLGKKEAINVARNLAEGSIQRKVTYSLIKNTGVLAGDLAASLAMVNTTGAAKTWGGILDAHNGRVTVDADGNYKLTDGKPWAQAIYEGEVRQLLEYYTEKLGGHLPGTKGIAKFAEKLGAKRVSNALLHMTNSDWARMMGRFGVNDYPSEVIEEEANMILGAILAPEDPNNRWAEFLDPQGQCDIFVGMALSIGAMQMPGGVISMSRYYKCKHEADKADVFAQTLIGDRWGEMRERIDNATNETLGGVLAEIAGDKTLNDTQRGVAAEYIKDIAYMRGFNLRTIANAKTDDEQQVAIETAQGDAFSRGYNADAEELAQIIADFEAANEAQGDYNEKAMAYMGAMQRLDEDIDMEASQQKLAIEQQTGEDGNVHVAYVSTGKEDEYREVYVKNGYIAVGSDGTIDANASDQTVAVYDPQEGKVVMMPTSGKAGLHHIGAVTPASELMAFVDQQAQQRKDEALAAARQAASGVAPMAEAGAESPEVTEVPEAGAGAEVAAGGSTDNMSGWMQGVPETIAPGMEVVVRASDGTEVQGVVTGNVRYENGEFVADPKGNMVEVVADGEAMHFYPSNAEDWLVSWYAGEEVAESPEGTESPEVAESPEGTESPEVAEVTEADAEAEVAPAETAPIPAEEAPVAEESTETAAPRTPEEEYAAMMADGMLDYDEATAIIENNIKEAEKALDKISKGKPKPGTDVAAFKAAKQKWQDDVAVAQAAVEYWQRMKGVHEGATAPAAAEQYAEPIGPRDIRAYEQPAGPEERKAVATEQYERAIGPERKAVASEQYAEPAGPRDIRAYEQPIGPEEAEKRESESAEDILKTVNELFSVADTYSKIEAAIIVSDAFDKGIDISAGIEGYEMAKEAKEYIEAYKRYRAGEDVDYLYIKTGMTRDEVIADVQGIFSASDASDNIVGSMTDIELLTAEELDYKRWKYSVDSDVIDDNFAINAISDFCKRMEDKYDSKGEVLPSGPEKGQEKPEVPEGTDVPEGDGVQGSAIDAETPATVAETEKVDRDRLLDAVRLRGFQFLHRWQHEAIEKMSIDELNKLASLVDKFTDALNMPNGKTRKDRIAEVGDEISEMVKAKYDELNASASEAGETSNTSGVEGEAAAEPTNGEGYTLTPKKYTTKKGKEIDMFVLKFDRELTKDEFAALKADAKTRFEWWSKEDGGFLVRSEDNARHMAELLGSKEAVEEAKPATMEEVKQVAESLGTGAEQQAQTENPVRTEKPDAGESSSTGESRTEGKEEAKQDTKRIVSDERMAELKERMRKKLLGQLNIGVDPELLAIGAELAVGHIERGLTKFADYAKQMIEDIGDTVRPYLKSFYNAVRDMPEAADYADKMDAYEDVREYDVASIGREEAPTKEEVAAQEKNEEVAEKSAIETEREIKKSANEKKSVSLQAENEPAVSRRGQLDEKAVKKFVDSVCLSLYDAVEKGADKPFKSIVELRKFANEVGLGIDSEGRDDVMLNELVEDAIVGAARFITNDAALNMHDIVGKDGMWNFFDKDVYDKVCRLYDMQPSINARSSNRIALQQYSTPIPMGFIADKFANGGRNEIGLEITAGNGMLVAFIPPVRLDVNEIDETRLKNLRKGNYRNVTDKDATEDYGKPKEYDFIVSNPPFGHTEAKDYDGYSISGLEHQIAINALNQMKDDGKAAIVIGGNMEYAPNGSVKSQKAFWSYLYDHYNVKGVIDMAGDLYKKQGTTYPTRMILIDGRRSEDERAQVRVFPPVKENAYRPANTFDDLWDIANEIINDNRKHNGTEILRSGAGQPVPDSKQQSGNGDGRTGSSKPAKNDGAAAGAGRRGSAGLERDAQQGEGVLQRGSRQNAGTGTAGSEAGESGGKVRGNDAEGTDRGTGADAVQRVADGGVRSGSERLDQKKSAPAKVERKDEKRELDTEKLPYRQHNTAFSLESVAPASMVEAMDETLKRIEDKYGNIDDFVTDELGYASVDEMHAALAAEQVDSVAMAIAQMKDGQGFVIGDQTGVGKGRQMAALIRWANKQGKKPVFFTQKADLFTDIYRDLADVGSADLVPFIVNSDGAMLDSDGKAVYKPLSAKAQETVFASGEIPEGYDFVVVTYSQVNTGDQQSKDEFMEAAKKSGQRTSKKDKTTSRPTPKATWIRNVVKDNYLFMDESHTGAGQSNTGYYMQSISKAAKAVTYASATFAKRPDTMPLYAMRTAMSEANVPLNALISIIQKGGVTLQEIMSRAMTSAGQMVRRERDMSDVRTDWKTIDDPEIVKKARSLYDRTITAFNAIIQFQEKYVNAAIAADDLQAAFQMESVGNKRGTKKMGIENVPFASKTYNYTKQIMLALKVDAIVNEVESEINAGRHPVIALESTMESTFKDFAGMELPEPTFAASLLRGLETVMQYTRKDDKGNEVSGKYLPSDLGEEGEQAYYELQDFIRESASDIFISPLDAIIEGLRAKGYKVGELTGRSTVVEKDDNGKYVVRKRTDKDKKKMQREFNSGALDVLILNKSASTGISLHASNKFSDQRQRSMIIAQPLSDINDYMQMIGRIDRTGQVHRGYYINLGLPVPAESRFLMMLSTKLKSLNANTTSAQESKSNEVEAPDLLNKYGSQMVVEYLKDHFDIYEKLGFPLKSGDSRIKTSTELADYTAKEDDARKITGYVALLSTDEQEDFYNDVVQRYTDHIKYLDDTGANDLKITVMPLRTETLEKKVSSPGTNPEGSNPFAHNAYVERVSMDILRKPMKADEIKKLIETINGNNNGEGRRSRLQKAILDLAQKHLDAEAERNEARKERDRKIVEDYATKINAQDKLSAEEKADAIAKREAELEVKRDEQYENAVKRTKSSDTLFYQRIGSFKVGKTYLIPEDLHASSLNMFTPAIFCGFKAKEDKLTQSSTQAVFAILNGIRKLEIKLSDGEALSNISSCTMTNYNAASDTGLYNWDEKIPTGSRKEGYILTGNILQAVGDTQREDGSYAGQLISYTDMEGNIHDGILMPDKWQPTMLKNSGVPINARLKQVKDGSIRRLESTDGKVKLEKRWGEWDLIVPKTKKEGSKYFENPDLLKLVSSAGFYQRGGEFHADISDENIAKVVSLLSKIGVRVPESLNDNVRYRTSEELDNFDVMDRIAEVVGASGAGMSKYAHGTTEDGQTYTIRVSNHAADEGNFDRNDEGDSDIIVSFVVSDDFDSSRQRNDPMTDEDNGRYQFVIDPKDFDEEFFKNAFDKFKESGRVDLMGSDVVFRDGKSDTATSPASMRSAVEDMAGRLKVKVRVVENAEEITDNNKRRERKKRKAKGYYDLATGEVVVVLPNHATAADAMATVAHEVIGHKGMRELVGEENYPAFLDEVYSHLDGALKERIDREAGRDFMSDPTTHYEEHRRVRMDELFAEMAEKPFEEFSNEELTFWQTIKEAVRRLLDKLLGGAKLPKWFTIGDNEIRYMLWRAKENLERGKEDPIQFAQDIVKRRELGLDSLEDDDNGPDRPDGTDGPGGGHGMPAYRTETDTPAFRRWFGNSKVVDEDGEPLVVYHMTPEEGFYTFDKSKIGDTNSMTFLEGFYFGNKAQEGSDWRRIDAYLAMEHPLEIDLDKADFDTIGAQEIADALRRGSYSREYEDYLVRNGIAEGIEDARRIEDDLMENMDGVIIRNTQYDAHDTEYIVFEPNQIKSATDNNGEYSSENDDIRYRDGESEEETLQDIMKEQSMGMAERLTAAKAIMMQNHKGDVEKRRQAFEALAANLAGIRKAAGLQKEYDKATVKRIADLARVMVSSDMMSGAGKGDIKRMLSIVKNSTGKTELATQVNALFDLMLDNQRNNAAAMLEKLTKVKATKVDAKGVVVQGQLDVNGQQVVKAFNKGQELGEKDLNDAIAEAQGNLGSDNNAVREEATNVLMGLQMAKTFNERVRDAINEIEDIKEEMRKASRATTEEREYYDSLADALRDAKTELVQAYYEIAGEMQQVIEGSREAAKAFQEQNIERINDIHHDANRDLEGMKRNEHYGSSEQGFLAKAANSSVARVLLNPLATFEQFMRLFGGKSANGEGYLFNRFMRGWVDARSNEIEGYRSKEKKIDEKVKEIFGKDAKDTSALIRLLGRMPKMNVDFVDGGEKRPHLLGAGNLMYIYMVDKMSDGRMKLRKMGITEDVVDEIEAALDPRLIEFADWMQDEFLTQTRNEYNETHKRVFGASMAAIDNYFPLKINQGSRSKSEDELDTPVLYEGVTTKTGSIIKRRRNNTALDLLNANAVEVLLDHIEKMERWNAFAEFNRDINTLRTYKLFENRVKNMVTVYGTGEKLWDMFNKTCHLAVGTYRPPVAMADEEAVNIAKGVATAKVSFRIFTAMKQLLSLPAYIADARPDLLARNLINPVGAWKWAMNNLPIFEERWKSRIAGDPRLMKSELDWKGWRSNVMQIASRVGMSPNAFVDALTVSIGAHAIYQSKLAAYKREGYSEEVAEKKAKQDATMAFNLTQQSSEGAFLSTMQRDRSWWTVMLTLFRNASMSYTRQLLDAVRNLTRSTFGGDDDMVEFMKKQYINDGMDEETATRNANRKFWKEYGRDAVRIALFGYVMQFAWNLGAYLPYLLLGDDDDEKQKMMDEVIAKSKYGWLEGLTGGDVMSEAGKMLELEQFNAQYLKKEMPITSDIYGLAKKFDNGYIGEGINDIINLVVQMGVGVNPQSIEDAVLAVIDVCGDDPRLAHEASIFIMRVINAPQSQIDKMYFDEIGMTGEEASKYSPVELAARYAKYRTIRDNFMTFDWDSEKSMAKYTKRANKDIKERMERLGDEEANERYAKHTEAYNYIYKNYMKGNQTDFVKRADAIKRMQDDFGMDEGTKAFRFFNAYKQDVNGNSHHDGIDDLAKKYLGSTTTEEAEGYRDRMIEKKASLVEKLDEIGFELGETRND